MSATRIVDLPVGCVPHRAARRGVGRFREVLRWRRWRSRGRRYAPPERHRGGSVVDAEAGLDKLAAQISQTVQWADCLQGCLEAGATAFLEFGPGHALSGMVASIEPGLPVRSLDDFRSFQGVRNWLARHLSD